MKRSDYRRDLKAMTAKQLSEWINEKTQWMLMYGDDNSATPLLNKIVYAKNLLTTKSTE